MKRSLLGVALAVLAGAPVAHARTYPTIQLSPGAATDAAISQDGRTARYAAYAAGGQVFLVRRAKPYGINGTPWKAGETHRASTARGGGAGNGRSWGPVFDGYDFIRDGRERIVAPKCMAFVSKADNLVAGDRNASADVFVRRLGSGRLTRIPAAGGATEVALDGLCETVAFAAGGTIYTAPADGRRSARRVSPSGGASSPNLSANGEDVTYARKGGVYFRSEGRTRRIASGTNPGADDWSKKVAFEDGGLIKWANLQGPTATEAIEQAGGDTPRGVSPSESAGGGFVFYAQGPRVRLNGFTSAMGDCGGADAVDPIGSGHGNYVVFTCAGGPAFLTYTGPK